MPRPSKIDQERGYMRSFWDEVGLLQADYSAVVTLSAWPTPRSSVWRFTLLFTPLLEHDVEQPLGDKRATIEYPNSYDTPLAAVLWGLARSLRQMVEDSDTGRKIARRSR